jgi:hypothetical protein
MSKNALFRRSGASKSQTEQSYSFWNILLRNFILLRLMFFVQHFNTNTCKLLSVFPYSTPQQQSVKTTIMSLLGIPSVYMFSFHGVAAPSRPGRPHYRRFTIRLRPTTLGRTPLDEGSARRRDLYLTTHNTHNRQTSMPPGGIRTRNPSKRRATDPRLRPRGHVDRLSLYYSIFSRH